MEPTTFYWFLNQENPYESEHYDPEIGEGLAWRTLLELAIDMDTLIALHPKVNRVYFQPLDVVTDDASEEKEKERRERIRDILHREGNRNPFFFPIRRYRAESIQRYRTLCGTGLGVKSHPTMGKILEFRPHDTEEVLDLPLSVVLNSRSTGFPKVAHSPERFLKGYRALRDACHRALNTQSPIAYDWAYFQKETFSEDAMRLFSIFRDQMDSFGVQNRQSSLENMKITLNRIDDMSVSEMVLKITTNFTPPYIKYCEVFMDKNVLRDKEHPFIKAYQPLRKRYHLIPSKLHW